MLASCRRRRKLVRMGMATMMLMTLRVVGAARIAEGSDRRRRVAVGVAAAVVVAAGVEAAVVVAAGHLDAVVQQLPAIAPMLPRTGHRRRSATLTPTS